MIQIDCFKAYDVRGKVPSQLNEDIAWRIGRAYVEFLRPKTVAVGRDIRLSSPGIFEAFTRGVTDGGADVVDIGIGGTELAYFATFSRKLDGGVMITASHNPPDYNGLKMVREEARPLSADTGLLEIRAIAEKGEFRPIERKGSITPIDIMPDYIEHLLSYVDTSNLKPLKIVVNAGNGGAGPIVDLLESHLPFEFIKIHHEPDGNFPNGVPNPMIEAKRKVTIDAVLANKADFGVAWDGDYDRCFLFDESGDFIEGYYIVGLLGQAFLEKHPGANIVYDPRLTWNTLEVADALNGTAVKEQVRPCVHQAGHARSRRRLRR